MPSYNPNYSVRPPARPAREQSQGLNDPMQQLRSAQTVNMSAELFEKLFLSQPPPSFSPRPAQWSDDDLDIKGAVKVDWRKSVGNPTPIALVGIVVSLTPLSCDLMGLFGADSSGVAGVATYYFFGGLLLILAAMLEWLLGNTFPSVVFSAYGAFFLSFAGTLTPSFSAFASFAPAGSTPSEGLKTQGFNASFAWFLVWMCVLSAIFFVCALRTNIVLVIIFFALVGVFGTLSGAYFLLAANFARNASTASTFVKAGGVCAFVASMAGWWNLLSILLETVDFPIQVPLGSLSRWIGPGKRERSMA
ncbi:GPR1/FUN34/yaaH family-domain-containing protein [Lasiosphaeria hispida]|uniref:GPR1/FUN34/yaaH family-domain-containing protein n=1 Tax=Lasiosphaeria hispida TaxID=260671 RepID=A0AAJ0HKS6_9PEZI|nr:GPR1/FUN34/yaaH family-domain-containing protein [Lasiosphaeria hispida]